jgi:membrane protein implicated in regulation of membrane protease activity
MAADRNIPDIFADLLKELTTLFRSEIRLARTEFSEKIALLGVSLGLIVVGAALVLAALFLLLQAAVAALIGYGFSPTVATLIVAAVVLLIGIVLLWVGLNRLHAKNLALKKTTEQLQRDVAAAKYQVTNP